MLGRQSRILNRLQLLRIRAIPSTSDKKHQEIIDAVRNSSLFNFMIFICHLAFVNSLILLFFVIVFQICTRYCSSAEAATAPLFRVIETLGADKVHIFIRY